MRKYLLLFLMLGSILQLSAYTIRGKIVDEADDAMLQASARLLKTDSTLVKGVLTDAKGAFALSNIKNGTYILETSFIGYDTQSRQITVKGADVNAGTIRMKPGSLMLREAEVVGVYTPIKVMQDTVEYTADAYRTQPNAVVEDLLKRLPGVEVSSEGKITANGKEVTKILVDGKEFFSDDPTVASRNLPVDMVDKLQVVDRKSDLARITGVDDGEEETVINLTVKRGMNNGYFGTLEGGYGTDDRYKANFNVNRFWNGNQVTLLGNFNNVNELGFQDGMSGRFRRFGGENGITTSQALGLNFNVGKGDIFRVGGNVMWNHTDRDSETESHRINYFTDSTSYINSERRSNDRGHNVRGDFRVQWKPDSFNTFEFRPNFSLSHNDSWSNTSSMNLDGYLRDVTRSLNDQKSRGTSYDIRGNLIYNHAFKSRRGRSFSVFVDYSLSNTREKTNSYSWNKFFLLNDSIDLNDQYADNHTWNNNISARVSWTEPIGNPAKGNYLTVAYRFQYRWNNADKLTYEWPVTWPDGWGGDPLYGSEMDYMPDLSNRFRNDYMNQDIRLGYKHVSRISTLDVGVSLMPQMSRSINLINDAKSIPERNVFNFAPYLRYRYRMGKSRSINIDYNGRSSQPSLTQLQPVADVSDPMHIVIGNPNLNPTFSHNLRLRFQDFNADAQRSIMAMVNASVTQNSIASKTTFDRLTGAQTTTYENVNGIWNVMAMNMISMPLKNRQFMFNNFLNLNYNTSAGFTNGEKNRSGSFTIRESPGISWRPDNVELELRPTYSLQATHYSLSSSDDRTVHTYGGRFNATYNAPFGLSVSTDVNFTKTSGYSQGFDRNEWRWNATIAYSFLRGRNLTVSLRAYDLLRQQSNISRTVNAQYTQDQSFNTLTRYFMLSVAYKFNTFGKGNEPESRERGFGGPGGGPGGPGGGGRPPRM